MFGLDEWLAGIGGNGAMAFVAAVLLGLRHATDPDHLTAVATLVLADERDGARRAGSLGLAWGLGHATTLLACGLPVVLFARNLPPALLEGAEVSIGIVIILLALRLLLRWGRGQLHSHPHSHGGLKHSHPHVHEGAHTGLAAGRHSHSHAEALGRSPLAAFGIGMVHGVGGTAAVGILAVGAASNQLSGMAALLFFAAATAVSIALVSATVGYALVRAPVAQRVSSLVPLFALASLVFGAWYALAAVGSPVSGF
jgi:hypothetical protein